MTIRKLFKKNTTRKDIPDTWRMLLDGETPSASIYCSKGHYGIITNHTIEKDGAVYPSVVCPEKGCDFHEFIILEGWNQNV